MPHNHPPRCCCEDDPRATEPGNRTIYPLVRCPSCIEHGELANLADNECPSCHQLPGRAPTDYCRQPDWHRSPAAISATYTTQPATRTTTPPTQTRASVPAEVQELADRMAADELANGGHVDLVGALRDSIDRARERRRTPLATPTPCPHCGLIDDHQGGCPATGQAPQPGAPG